MLEPVAQPMSVAAFFAWQERQAERYELVGGVPVRRIAERAWIKQRVVGLDAAAELPGLGITLSLADLYDGIAFPARPRLVQDETPGAPAG